MQDNEARADRSSISELLFFWVVKYFTFLWLVVRYFVLIL